MAGLSFVYITKCPVNGQSDSLGSITIKIASDAPLPKNEILDILPLGWLAFKVNAASDKTIERAIFLTIFYKSP
jgi:hypothetical protein